jgi:hypothetical protein
MRRVTLIVLIASALLVMLDLVGALAGKPLGFPYSPLGVVSLLIYLAVGLLGAWWVNFTAGVWAAAVVGFLDGTLGPLLSWLIGSGPVGQTITEPRIFAYSVTVITVTAILAGFVGGAVGCWLERRRGTRRVVPH